MQMERVCRVPDCSRPARCKGLCKRHYEHSLRGKKLAPIRSYGAGSISKGYRYLFKPDHPNATKHGRIAEHRFVMSELLGRPLFEFENVHHRDGNRSNNDPRNLELWVRSQPYGQRAIDMVSWAHEILNLYGELSR